MTAPLGVVQALVQGVRGREEAEGDGGVNMLGERRVLKEIAS